MITWMKDLNEMFSYVISWFLQSIRYTIILRLIDNDYWIWVNEVSLSQIESLNVVFTSGIFRAYEWGTSFTHTMCCCRLYTSKIITCTQNKGSSYVCVRQMCVLLPAVAIFS